jgi:hypothetical protein
MWGEMPTAFPREMAWLGVSTYDFGPTLFCSEEMRLTAWDKSYYFHLLRAQNLSPPPFHLFITAISPAHLNNKDPLVGSHKMLCKRERRWSQPT